MNKYSRQNSDFSRTDLRFLDFWSVISDEIGDHRLEINSSARCADELFPKTSVHPEHLKNLVLGSLKKQHDHLDQAIDLTNLLDELGRSAWELRQNGSDDLFDIELLEEIAWHIGTRYPYLIEMPRIDVRYSAPTNTRLKTAPKTQILSISTFNTIRKNRQL